ncbi:MAG: BrnT family toxin [Acidobacteriia bacterium]|nr:BrnT family toxin [Terriglobia bacterium]
MRHPSSSIHRCCSDPGHSGTEVREFTPGHTENGRLLFVYHTERAGRIRIIGARSATRRERRQHEEGH